MRYPEFLPENGRIGLIAPSFGCARVEDLAQLDSAIERLESMGYSVVEGPNCRVALGIGKSNTPEKCAEEINDFFINRNVDAIISCGGGELMCEDLPFVDFERIKRARAKWYSGYSDNTNLTFLLPTLCDTAAIYGPGIKPFGMRPWHACVEDTWALLKGERLEFKNYDGWEDRTHAEEVPDGVTPDYLAPYNINMPYEQTIVGGETVSFAGRLIGGCTDCLVTLCGTRFDRVAEFCERYREDGIIWFLESCDLNPMSVRRALWQMEQAGWFKYVKGFLIGRPLHYYDDFGGFTCRDAAIGILEKYGVPIVLDIDLGHLSPRIPIVSGALAEVKASGNEFTLKTVLK